MAVRKGSDLMCSRRTALTVPYLPISPQTMLVLVETSAGYGLFKACGAAVGVSRSR